MTAPTCIIDPVTTETKSDTAKTRMTRATRDPAKTAPQSRLTPEVAERILEAIRVGNQIQVAAAAAGIARDTLYTWLKKGRAAKTGAYHDFAVGLDLALAESETRDLARVDAAGDEVWQAVAWKLERRYPDRYGKRTRLDSNVTVTAKPMLDYSKLDQRDLDDLERIYLKGSPDADDPALTDGARPALELLPAADVDGEVVDETDVT